MEMHMAKHGDLVSYQDEKAYYRLNNGWLFGDDARTYGQIMPNGDVVSVDE